MKVKINLLFLMSLHPRALDESMLVPWDDDDDDNDHNYDDDYEEDDDHLQK